MAHDAVDKFDKTRVIKRGEVYPLRLFLKLTRMGSLGLRQARETGLRIVYHGSTAWVSGDDFVDWIRSPDRTTERWDNNRRGAVREESEDAGRPGQGTP